MIAYRRTKGGWFCNVGFFDRQKRERDMFVMSKPAVRLGMATLLLVSLAACQKEDSSSNGKGPAEKAGQQLDQAAERAGEELNKAAQMAGKGLQQLGQKIQNEAGQAQQSPPQKKE